MRWGKFILGLLLAAIGLILALPFLALLAAMSASWLRLDISVSPITVVPGLTHALPAATVVGFIALIVGARIMTRARPGG